MAAQGGEICYNSGQVLVPTPTNCMRLDNGKSFQTGVQPKELYTSGDEVIPKARKPYTITKQRERWTEEEHKKFLEALKLYGRAWRRIEEHIGTKTAVQIRSHAQKFFSKVVRESNTSSIPMKSIEIPPPRPKRKPLHPYPRKLVHQSAKGLSVCEQPERSPSPIASIYEQENRSPSSVMSAIESSTMESTVSNPSNHCSSPVSSATGPFPMGFLVEKQENISSSTTSLVEKDGISPSPAQASAGSSQHDKASMEWNVGCKDHDCAKEASSVEVPTMSLKLFGRTVLVTDSHRPSSPIAGDILQHHKSSPLTDSENKQEGAVQDQAQPSPRNTVQRDFSLHQCQSGWNPWPCETSPLYYCMQFRQGAYSAEASSPMPWWALCSSLPLPPLHFNGTPSRETPSESCMQASDGKESDKEGFSTSANNGSVKEVESGDGNCDLVDSQNNDKVKEPIAVVCLKASENVAFSSQKARSSGNDKGQAAVFCLKASENSAFSSQSVGSRNFGKGFVPYKRCVTEREIQQPHIGSDEREGQRIRLCL
ncbi:hypothetical protein MRB53_022660 [Persea americana]|uniref:Uncharacterized protein n=1 Tax=Persea americana TaxID=3435 RepID=A0ACC2L790_PERAE|nr:hypothetical protein MRB53_022660 [Persea americana]